MGSSKLDGYRKRFGEVLTHLLIVHALIQYAGAFGGISFCDVSGPHRDMFPAYFLSLRDCLCEQLILLSLNRFFKLYYTNRETLYETFETCM